MLWMPMLLAGLMLLVADAAGWIDLSTKPLARVIKWVAAATVAWFLPAFAQKMFHLRIDEKQLDLWKLLILSVLGSALFTALFKWIWRSYGPAPEGHRRCPHCRKPVLKVMLECPACRVKLESR